MGETERQAIARKGSDIASLESCVHFVQNHDTLHFTSEGGRMVVREFDTAVWSVVRSVVRGH